MSEQGTVEGFAMERLGENELASPGEGFRADLGGRRQSATGSRLCKRSFPAWV